MIRKPVAAVGLLGALLAALVAGLALPNHAVAVQNAGTFVGPAPNRCVSIVVAFQEPAFGISGGGVIRTATTSYDGAPPGCAGGTRLESPGASRVNQVLQKFVGTSWVYCSGTQTGDYYNTSTSTNKIIQSNYGASPICGGGAYRGMGRGWVSGFGGAVVTGQYGL